jgi:hypothetical protein
MNTDGDQMAMSMLMDSGFCGNDGFPRDNRS